jgi:hypothetical protein
MLFLLRFLAVIGVLAVIAHAGRALFSLLRGGVDMFVAKDLHEVRAQRGDLTGMQEAVDLRRMGRQRRGIALVKLVLWIGLLIVPSFTSWALQMRAAYALLWLLPRPRGGIGVRARFHTTVLK